MKYLENVLLFARKHYILALPLFLINVVASLAGKPSTGFMSGIMNSFSGMNSMSGFLDTPFAIPGILLASGLISIAVLLKTVLSAASTPGTYGMINSSLENVKCDPFKDFIVELKKHFVKYIIYWIANSIFWIILVLSLLLITGLSFAAGGSKTFILIILGTFVIVGAIYIGINMSLWFPAMVADDLNVISALKKSFRIVNGNFWMVLGVNMLLSLGASLIGSLVSILDQVPFIGIIARALPSTLSSFILMIFYMIFYKNNSSL